MAIAEVMSAAGRAAVGDETPRRQTERRHAVQGKGADILNRHLSNEP